MATPPKTLNSRITWTTLLPLLGVEGVSNTILPQTVRCPVCNGDQLFICEDQVLGGQWASCQSCRFAGDLVELAAATWSIGVPEAVTRLSQAGLFPDPLTNEDVAGYMANHVAYRHRLLQFWQKARNEPRQASASVRHLLRKFSLLQASQSPAWPQEAGRFVGSATRQDVESLFAPFSHEPQDRVNGNGRKTKRRGGGPGKRRLFHGRDWEDLLVIAYFDLPGRISGFLFIGREADPDAGDYIFKRANFGGTVRRVREAGIGMLAGLDDGPHPQLGDALFVISNPVVGILLKAQGLRDSLYQLPVVLSHFSHEIRTLNIPDRLVDRQLIFFGDQSGLRMASRCDGSVSSYQISVSEIERRLNHRNPLDWLRLIRKHSSHWTIALRQQLRALSPKSAGELLGQMEFTPAEMRSFSATCDPTLRDRLKQFDPHRVARRRVLVGGQSIVEAETGWEIEKTGEKLCNMPIRIEEVLTTNGGETFYRGIVPAPNAVTHFTVPARDVDHRGLFQCVRDRLIEQSAGMLNFQWKWNKRSAFVAMELNPPTIVAGADRIGWDPTRRCFLFPKFSITCRGAVNSDLLPLAIDDDVPARHLVPPMPLHRGEIDALSAERTEVAIVWAMMACVVHNIFTGATHSRPSGIILDGVGAQTTGPAVARLLGCAELDLRQRCRTLSVLERIDERCARHGWPMAVRLPKGPLTVTANWIDNPGPRNAIIALDRYAALSVGSNSGFCTIRSFESSVALGELYNAIPNLIPAYVKDACERRLWIDQAAEHEVFNILADIASWFARQGGNIAAVESARRVLSIDGLAPCVSFVDLALHMLQQWEIKRAHDVSDISGKKHATIVYRSGRGVRPELMWISVKSINQVLVAKHAPALNLTAIEQSLHNANAWFGTEPYREEDGILIHDSWWSCQKRHWTAIHGDAGYGTDRF